jgi:hypothetical protein
MGRAQNKTFSHVLSRLPSSRKASFCQTRNRSFFLLIISQSAHGLVPDKTTKNIPFAKKDEKQKTLPNLRFFQTRIISVELHPPHHFFPSGRVKD